MSMFGQARSLLYYCFLLLIYLFLTIIFLLLFLILHFWIWVLRPALIFHWMPAPRNSWHKDLVLPVLPIFCRSCLFYPSSLFRRSSLFYPSSLFCRCCLFEFHDWIFRHLKFLSFGLSPPFKSICSPCPPVIKRNNRSRFALIGWKCEITEILNVFRFVFKFFST